VTDISTLIKKLTDIEQSIGVETNYVLLSKVIDAQDFVLQIQKNALEIVRRGPLGSVGPAEPVRKRFLEKFGQFFTRAA
jgi:hypothetical protein